MGETQWGSVNIRCVVSWDGWELLLQCPRASSGQKGWQGGTARWFKLLWNKGRSSIRQTLPTVKYTWTIRRECFISGGIHLETERTLQKIHVSLKAGLDNCRGFFSDFNLQVLSFFSRFRKIWIFVTNGFQKNIWVEVLKGRYLFY